MRFGIVYPNSESTVDAKLAATTATVAEECGFEHLLTWDHYMGGDTNRTFDAWALLSYFAGKTERIRLGTCVTPMPFRPPAQLAKVIATVDQLSAGRVTPGIGAGWYRPEFEAFSSWDDASTRFRKTREGVKLMLRLWSEQIVDFSGKYYSTKGAILEPKPAQYPHPPLWFGSTGKDMTSLASNIGDGWLPTYIKPAIYAEIAGRIRQTLKERSPGKKFTFAYNQLVPLKTAEGYIKLAEEFDALGCEQIIVNWEYPKDEVVSRLEWFSKEVMPSFSK
ncbi:MAG: LLM class flavin-dependent oxidoreductase [Thaumarchaeota archaeon]|nr:LLM class flavin-dependent oxidoreductase [Nitrososphaerota archaeon]